MGNAASNFNYDKLSETKLLIRIVTSRRRSFEFELNSNYIKKWEMKLWVLAVITIWEQMTVMGFCGFNTEAATGIVL